MTLRRTPEDFLVEELATPEFLSGLRPSPSIGNQHGVFRLEKTQLTTPHAAQMLASALNVRNAAVEYAGLKDKHARTVQLVTVSVPTVADAALLPKETAGPKWSAALQGWSAQPITAAELEGNRFRIVVRDVRPEDEAAIRFRASLLGTGRGSLSIVNYFGAQRFGSARHGEGWIAKELIAGRFEQALRLAIGTPSRKDTGVTRTFTRMLASGWGEWGRLAKELPRCPEKKAIERLAFMASRRSEPIDDRGFREAFVALPYFLQQLYVEAYQSHLWNELARRIVRRATPASSMLQADDEFGKMLFPAFAAVSDELRHLQLPLLAPESIARDPWREDLEAVLAAEKIALSELKIPGLRRPYFGEALRSLFVEARGVRIAPAETDELSQRGLRKVDVCFDLPRGAYATVVLRALGQ